MLFYVFTALICAIFYVWYRVIRCLNYWKDRNVPYVKPIFPLGNLGDVGKKHLGWALGDIYLKLKDKGDFAGIHFLMSPQILPLSMDLIKNILVTDFQYFTDRKIYYNEVDDPLSAHLFAIRGEKWRTWRQLISPTFSSGKMKMMFPIVVSHANKLQKYIEKEVNTTSPISMKHVSVRYAADVIGMAAFGLECNALVDDDSEIVKVGKYFFSFNTFIDRMKFFFQFSYEDLCRKLRMRFNHPILEEFFMRVIKETIRLRDTGVVDQNDFMKHLLEIRDSEKGAKMTFNELAAQAFVMFFGGFETSANTIEWFLCNMAGNPEIQDRARQEVNEVFKKYNGELTFDSIKELTYLRQCVDETLRLYPPAAQLFRQCVKDYKIPGTDYIIEKDTQIFIPVVGVHMDPDNYPNPEVFDPDRFTPENIKSRHPMANLAFGAGPRNCVGMRFGLMQVTVGLAYILKNFKFTFDSKTKLPLEVDGNDVILLPKGGAWFNVEKIAT
ncbi:hypothetical protein DMENIID0001_019260 [Sergentomyia squamirostris]